MLTRHTRKFLNFIEKSTVNFENKVVLFSYIHENFPDNESSINATLRYLVQKGYLRVSYFGKEPKGVVLTELSLRRREFVFESVKEFLFKSILVPISVSVVTSLVTLWLSGLL